MAEMSENRPAEASNLRSLKNAVSLLVLVFCFLAFPLFIIFSALNNLYQVKIGNLRQQKLDQMHGRLEYLEKYSNNGRYLHFLLLRLAENAEKAAVPADFLKAAFVNLHQRFGALLSHTTLVRSNVLEVGSVREAASNVADERPRSGVSEGSNSRA